jgi:predicted transcriptional regulator YdeE
MADGSKLDPEASYTVAYFNGSIPSIDKEPELVLQQTWQEAFLQWLDEQGGVIKKPEMTITLDYEI